MHQLIEAELTYHTHFYFEDNSRVTFSKTTSTNICNTLKQYLKKM